MSEERMRKVSMQMIFHCAPTFQRLKPSSLIMIDPEDLEVLERQTAQAGLSGCQALPRKSERYVAAVSGG